jgi:transcriptional antiterminator RfaH
MGLKNLPNSYAWWVAKTKTHQEFKAEKNLSQQGFITFCPIYKKEIKRGNQFQIKLQPLFTGYLFIHANGFAQKNIHLIRSTIGLISLLKIDESILYVPPQIIHKLKSNHEQKNNPANAYFKPGSSVKIINGIYKGIEAIYETDNGADRAIILLSLIQKQTKLSLRKQDLIKN